MVDKIECERSTVKSVTDHALCIAWRLWTNTNMLTRCGWSWLVLAALHRLMMINLETWDTDQTSLV